MQVSKVLDLNQLEYYGTKSNLLKNLIFTWQKNVYNDVPSVKNQVYSPVVLLTITSLLIIKVNVHLDISLYSVIQADFFICTTLKYTNASTDMYWIKPKLYNDNFC